MAQALALVESFVISAVIIVAVVWVKKVTIGCEYCLLVHPTSPH